MRSSWKIKLFGNLDFGWVRAKVEGGSFSVAVTCRSCGARTSPGPTFRPFDFILAARYEALQYTAWTSLCGQILSRSAEHSEQENIRTLVNSSSHIPGGPMVSDLSFYSQSARRPREDRSFGATLRDGRP